MNKPAMLLAAVVLAFGCSSSDPAPTGGGGDGKAPGAACEKAAECAGFKCCGGTGLSRACIGGKCATEATTCGTCEG